MRGFLRGNKYPGMVMLDEEDVDVLLKHKWHILKRGNTKYCARTLASGSKVFLHRLVMERIVSRSLLREEHIDHINRNGLDNRRENIRIVTRAQNRQNSMGRRKHSKFKGVTWNIKNKKWQVQLTLNGKHCRLGYFDDEIDAAKQYDQSAFFLFGEYARINFYLFCVDPLWNIEDKATHRGRARKGEKH